MSVDYFLYLLFVPLTALSSFFLCPSLLFIFIPVFLSHIKNIYILWFILVSWRTRLAAVLVPSNELLLTDYMNYLNEWINYSELINVYTCQVYTLFSIYSSSNVYFPYPNTVVWLISDLSQPSGLQYSFQGSGKWLMLHWHLYSKIHRSKISLNSFSGLFYFICQLQPLSLVFLGSFYNT